MSSTITTADFAQTLPEVIRNDTSLYALGQVIAGELRTLSQELELATIYTRIDELPETVLDILAYDFKVDWWDYAYSLEEKRQTLKDSWNVHRHLGTKYAVQTAISAIYPDTEVQEWFTYGGEPYSFKLLIDAMYQDVDAEKHQQVLARVDYYKNLRSHLEGVEYTAQPDGFATAYAGAAQAGMELEITAEVNVYGVG